MGGSALDNCTVGFDATAGSVVGFYTAGHCGSPRQYWTSTTVIGAAIGLATSYSSAINADADIMFMQMTTNSIVNKFYSPGLIVRGSRLDTIPNGSMVCHQGRTSGHACGSVTSSTYKPTWGGACPSTCSAAFLAFNATAAGGDSGGPAFYGGQPMGIVKSGSSTFTVASWLKYGPPSVSLF